MVPPRIEKKLRQLTPAAPALARAAWHVYLSGEGAERSEAEELLDILLYQSIHKGYAEEILLEPAPLQDCAGEYPLGTILYPAEHQYGVFGLREDEWIRHVLLVGMTGAGKTNLAFHLLQLLKRNNKPFLVFDWKQNYRDLRTLPEFTDLAVFTVARPARPFRFNPLMPPPGVAHGEWLMKLVDVIKHAYFVGDGVEYLLRRAIDWTYQQNQEHGGTPMFHTVLAHLQQQRLQGRMSLWKASATCQGGPVCGCSQGPKRLDGPSSPGRKHQSDQAES